MAHARKAAVALAALASCAGPGGSFDGGDRHAAFDGAGPARSDDGPDLSLFDLQARLAARAASFVGHSGTFQVGPERFNADCTGFIEAVYEAEGIPLRALMRAAAPDERSGVAAAFVATRAYGSVFGRRGEWPSPGDLIFWHDTYDRNGNGRADDRFTHAGIVEYVVDGTVVFLHRGGKGVARGAMTRTRPDEKAADGVLLNSHIRSKTASRTGVPVLAGALFSAYGRIEPWRVPGPVAMPYR